MIHTLILLVAGAWSGVPSQVVEHAYDINFGSFRSAYSCRFAEETVERILETLGSQDIRVRCISGAPWDRPASNLRIMVEHTSLALADEETTETVEGSYMPVRLTYRASCSFYEAMVRGVLDAHEIRNYKRRGICRDSQGRINFEFETLKPL